MTHRVGAKGQVVIPKEIRERIGLQPGAEVDFALGKRGVTLSPRKGSKRLGGRFAESGMAERLLADRAREPR